MHVAFGFVKRTLGWKNFMPEKSIVPCTFLWCHTGTRLANLTMLSPYWDFLWWENKEAMFWSLHPLVDKTSNKHFLKPLIFQGHTKIAQYTVHVNLEPLNQLWCQLFFLTLWQISVLRWYKRWFAKMIFSSMKHFHIFATLFWMVATFFLVFSHFAGIRIICVQMS